MYIHKKLKIHILRVFVNKQVLLFLNNVGQRGTKNELFQLDTEHANIISFFKQESRGPHHQSNNKHDEISLMES